MRHLPLVVLIGALFPLCLYAADAATGGTTGPQKAPTCSEKTGSTVTTAKDAKTAIEQSDKTSHDIVIVSPDGKVQVTSMCNPQCIQGMIKNQDGTPSQKPCPPGQVTMNLPTGASVTCSKAQDACGKASESLKNSPEMLDALAKGDSAKAAQLAADAFRQVPEIQTGLQKAAQDILNSSFAEGLPSSLQGVAKDMQKGLSDSLKAIAAGDFQKLEEIGKSLSQNPAIQEFVKNPQNFINQLMASAPPEMREALGQIAPVLCGFVGDASCLQAVQSTFGGALAGGLNEQPVQVTWPGGSSPYLIEQRRRLMEEIDRNPALRQTIAAVIATEKGGGGPGSQAVLESMVNRCVQMNCSSLSQPIYNGFYGPVNRGEVASYLARGVSQSDLAVADAAIQAVRGGSNLIEFRTDQGMQNEVRGARVANIGGEWFADMNGNASWAARQMQMQAAYDAQYPNAVIPRSDFSNGVTSFVTGLAQGGVGMGMSGLSPFSGIASGLGSFIPSLSGGASGGVTSLLSGFLGGGSSSGGIGSLISGITRFLGFGGGSSGGSSGGAASSSGSPTTPTAPTAPVIPTQSGSSSTTVVQPVIQISASPLGNTAYTVAWAALGVSATPSCQLLQETTVLASGNSGAYTGVRNDNAALTLTLLCTPSDNRAAAASARRTVVISAQQ